MSTPADLSVSPSAPEASWQLDDAEVRATKYPYTFYKPSVKAIAKLGPGNAVELIFAPKKKLSGMPKGERLWVRIERIEGAQFIGTLVHAAGFIRDLPTGTRVQFEARHIINTDVDDPVPDPTQPYRQLCVVTHAVLESNARVGMLARSVPMNAQHSGWRMRTGGEADRDLLDYHSYQIVTLGAVLRQDDSILGVLQTPPLCAFRRDPDTGVFVPLPYTSYDDIAIESIMGSLAPKSSYH